MSIPTQIRSVRSHAGRQKWRLELAAERGVNGTQAMDLLGDVLNAVHLQGQLHFSDVVKPPWALELAASRNSVQLHFVASGQAVLDAGNGPETLTSGALAIVPGKLTHTLSNATSNESARLVCGTFSYEGCVTHPLFEHLPPIVMQPDVDDIWLKHSMRMLAEETHAGRAGAAAIVDRSVEIVLIQALRQCIEQGTHDVAFFTAMSDRSLARALAAIHAEPSANWTVEKLAREALLSRTAFATHFHEVVGTSPLQYLTSWRMLLASQLLRQPGVTITEVAGRVGYRSEGSFGKVFKRSTGISPGRYQRIDVLTARESDEPESAVSNCPPESLHAGYSPDKSGAPG